MSPKFIQNLYISVMVMTHNAGTAFEKDRLVTKTSEPR